MSNRFNAFPKTNYGVSPVPTGYGSPSPASISIPPCGIEDIDRALFTLFNVELPVTVDVKGEQKKVPVVFASGERWAMMKKNRGLRDKNGSLILPMMALMRTGVQQDPSADIVGRGSNQHTGEIVIARRLSERDRNYQALINRSLIENSPNLAQHYVLTDEGLTTNSENIGDLKYDVDIDNGAHLSSIRDNNVWETIVAPAPQYITAMYEVEVWTQYHEEMNQISEFLMSSFLPQTRGWKLTTDKGYWFVARVDGNFESDNNFSDMSTSERVIKTRFNVIVPAYIFASRAPGAPVPVRRYLSSPKVSFDVTSTEPADFDSIGDDIVEEPNLGADDPTLPGEPLRSRRRDGRRTGDERLYPSTNTVNENDPALDAYPRGRNVPKYRKVPYVDARGRKRFRFVRVSTVNEQAGETVYTGDFTLD